MKKILYIILVSILFLPKITFAAEAKLLLFSSSGAYSVSKDLPIKLIVNSGGGLGVNAAESVIKFNPKEMTVSSVDLKNSVFDLWARKPKIDNIKGTLAFSGGTTKSYKGFGGLVFTIIFSPKKIITTNVLLSTTTSQVLAADGYATNILNRTSNGSYNLVSKLNFNKFASSRNSARGKMLINDKQKNKLSYINPLDSLRYDFSTSTELEQLYKRFSQTVAITYIKQYEKTKFPSSTAGKFLNTKIATTTTYYYIGPVSRKIYKLDNAVMAFKLFQTIGQTMPWPEISRIPDGI